MKRIANIILIVCACGAMAAAQDLKVPDRVTAGAGATIQTSGSGDATLYVSGPATAIKRSVKLGEDVTLQPEDVRTAGLYTVAIGGGASRTFYVVPAQAATVAFLARPSRVPVDRKDVISGVAFVFDSYKNLVLAPANVKFDLSVADSASASRTVATRDGIAWTKLDSSKRQGAAQFTASVGNTSVRRVVQLTASDPCNLRFHARPSKLGVEVETDPVRDCSGNPLPDGTIVTFTESDGKTRSTIDARIKRGVARADLPGTPNATISVASGVVLGNEVRWGGGR